MEGNRSFLFAAVLAASLADDAHRVFAGVADGVSPSGAATEYAQSHVPVAEGVIEQYLLDPRGEVEGLLLADDSCMYVTSRAEKDLLSP
jgi:hypothetical protein